MNLFRNGFRFFFLTGILAFTAQAQFIEDAVRLSTPPNVVSARAAAMGNAFTGVADDFSAIYFNPAGLALLRRAEFSAGLMSANGQTETTFIGSTTTDDDGTFRLNNLGLALPFPVDRGSLVIGVGFNTLIDYSGARAYSAYNPMSSIIPSLYNDNADYDLAWNTGLEEYYELENPLRDSIYFPIADQVQQENATLLSGSLSQWSFGGSAEVAKDLMVGLSINVLTGEFISDRVFTEEDTRGIHDGDINGVDIVRTDFQRLRMRERLEQQISGFNLKFGALYNYQNIFRGGVTIQTPTSFVIDERFERSATTDFAGLTEAYSFENPAYGYDISMPWVFGFGASYAPLDFLRISADLDLRDYTDLEFSGDNAFDPTIASDLNRSIRDQLRNTTNYRVGIEFQVPHTGFILRGGFGVDQSPYEESAFTEAPEGLNYDRTTISGGVGYIFRERFILNATFMTSTYDDYRFIYDDPYPAAEYVRTSETTTNTALMFSMSYLF